MKPKLFVSGDIDGFFGLFIDNLLQLMLVVVLGSAIAGLPQTFILQRILPGAAVSILAGNLFYSWQAYQLAKKTGRQDVTALPYGINTPSLVAFLFLIMGPIYQATGNIDLTWKAGLFACLISGLIETAGAFFGDWLRRHTPRAALLASLAGIAITFIALGFIFQIFAVPMIALFPMLIILFIYSSGVKLPLGLPGGFVAVVIGTAIVWILKALGYSFFESPTVHSPLGFFPPHPVPQELFSFLTSSWGWKYMSVIFPMALFNLLGSLQNLESAEAAGDRYETRSSLLVNGFCSILAAFLGSPFPTTIYIGHLAWKRMGARIGYSILNGTVITLLCLFGAVSLVLKFVPVEVTLGILLWIGIVMTAQAFQEVPKKHALGVAFGLIPALAAWTLIVVETTLRKAGTSLQAIAPQFGSELYIDGVISLSQGFLLSSMILAAMLILAMEREFKKAFGWALAASLFSFVGLIHAYDLTATGVQNRFGFFAAPNFSFAYFLGALFLLYLEWRKRKTIQTSTTLPE